MKYEWRKKDKKLYLPKSEKPEKITVPNYKYITISGEGNPNEEDFSARVGALYSFSYGVRMSYKWGNPPENYYEYTVFPLEGIWGLADVEKGFSKKNLSYTIMIRQPDFLDKKLFDNVIEVIKGKNNSPYIDDLNFENIEDGECVQIMHIGLYDDEQKTFDVLDSYIEDSHLKKRKLEHKEIYISDTKKVPAEKMKTVLRYFLQK